MCCQIIITMTLLFSSYIGLSSHYFFFLTPHFNKWSTSGRNALFLFKGDMGTASGTLLLCVTYWTLPSNRDHKILFISPPPWCSPSLEDSESKHLKMHAVSGLRSTLLLCQDKDWDRSCQSVCTYNHLPLPHTKAREQTWISPQNRGKGKQQQSVSWQSIFPLCCSSRWIRLVPAEWHTRPCISPGKFAGEHAARAPVGCSWQLAGSVPGTASWGSSLPPSRHRNSCPALWRPLHVSNSRTCAEAALCASLKTKLISHNRTAHALYI